jgi:hypothetical protein
MICTYSNKCNRISATGCDEKCQTHYDYSCHFTWIYNGETKRCHKLSHSDGLCKKHKKMKKCECHKFCNGYYWDNSKLCRSCKKRKSTAKCDHKSCENTINIYDQHLGYKLCEFHQSRDGKYFCDYNHRANNLFPVGDRKNYRFICPYCFNKEGYKKEDLVSIPFTIPFFTKPSSKIKCHNHGFIASIEDSPCSLNLEECQLEVITSPIIKKFIKTWYDWSPDFYHHLNTENQNKILFRDQHWLVYDDVMSLIEKIKEKIIETVGEKNCGNIVFDYLFSRATITNH